MIEEIQSYTFTYTPWEREFPIRMCKLFIVAKSRKEAELIALDKGWKFFDQDCTVQVSEDFQGYRQVLGDEK